MTAEEELRQIKADQIRMKREAAARARRLAITFWSTEDRDRALKFAEELEAQADELAREALPPARPQTTQVQMQVQQQGPPVKDEDERKE